MTLGWWVSELITNAITAYQDLSAHAPLPPVRLWLASDTGLVLPPELGGNP